VQCSLIWYRNTRLDMSMETKDGSVKRTHQAQVVFKSWKRAGVVRPPKELLQLRELLLRQHYAFAKIINTTMSWADRRLEEMGHRPHHRVDRPSAGFAKCEIGTGNAARVGSALMLVR
jgi:hypothetical protein